MRLNFPLKGIGKVPGVYLVQEFGADPIASQDTWYGNILVKKGQHVYKVLSNMNGHNGIDWAAPRSYAVYAVHDGFIVEATSKETGYGLRVSQYWEADGFQWVATFGHFLSTAYPDILWDFNNRKVPVKGGQRIGQVDSSGYSTGDHLHFTLQKYKNNQIFEPTNGFGGAVDPTPFLIGEPAMSNTLLIKKGDEYGFYVPATNEQALIDKGLNYGVPIPTLNGSSVDWANLKPDIIIS